MSDVAERSSRHGLPFLVAAQAQKEVTHNEAIALIDLLLNAHADAVLAEPPSSPQFGRCWIVADGGLGSWQGQAGAVAGWTAGGWRFVQVPVGTSMRVGAVRMIRAEQGWTAPPTVAVPSGGGIVDVEARAAISQLIELFRAQGVVAM